MTQATIPAIDYKNTLNLPQTSFPMKAELPKKEPVWIDFWAKQSIYSKRIFQNEGKSAFVLHDGPPYANGQIHHGHILNKILKDFIVKYHNFSGFISEYVPGWDCHGLPIEHQVDKNLGPKKKELSCVQIRQACREYAQSFVEIQKEQFKRLGILGRFDQPYLTMDFEYEAQIAKQLADCVEEGLVYRGCKPVYWCMRCKTALAEAEVEYDDHRSPSIYVKFRFAGCSEDISSRLQDKPLFFVIWTTTPWTLAANQAVALHKSYTYVAVQVGSEVWIVAEGLLDQIRSVFNLKEIRVLTQLPSKKLEHQLLWHPFQERKVPVVLSNHVTLEQGTGCVHIAPAHGQEDYEVGLRYHLPIVNPIDADGKMTELGGVPEWIGQRVWELNLKVIELLEKKAALAHPAAEMVHSYPHCWRCKEPVIFRSTPQWFLSMEKKDLKNRALDAIRRTQWVPSWGRERIYGMVENRSDWCLSRQRSWGVPIVAFCCKTCAEILLDASIIRFVAAIFEQEGADAWFAKSASELLPENTRCPSCQGAEFEKQNDILDVWFDSGVSFAAVLEKRPLLQFPADLYLEGSDQHRGWFHSSLLVSVATRNQAPYKTVLTHGFVVDGQGKKYSKSAKNYVAPDKILDNLGAEILRLWVAAEDYRNDIRVSDEILSRLTETYRKIRNTCRYLLGNLYDFVPDQDLLDVSQLTEMDRFALHSLVKFGQKLQDAYKKYEFHQIYHTLNHFCTVELSSFYLDILKDRLYTSVASSVKRRSAQTVLFYLAKTLSVWMAPILSFTAEEVWQALPNFRGKSESVFLADFHTIFEEGSRWIDEELGARFEKVQLIRNEVLKALELARKDKRIGSSLEAQVKISASGPIAALLKFYELQWPTFLIVSQVVLTFEAEDSAYESAVIPDFKIQVLKAEGQKCERCWNYSITVGRHSNATDLCERCTKVMEENIEVATRRV